MLLQAFQGNLEKLLLMVFYVRLGYLAAQSTDSVHFLMKPRDFLFFECPAYSWAGVVSSGV